MNISAYKGSVLAPEFLVAAHNLEGSPRLNFADRLLGGFAGFHRNKMLATQFFRAAELEQRTGFEPVTPGSITYIPEACSYEIYGFFRCSAAELSLLFNFADWLGGRDSNPRLCFASLRPPNKSSANVLLNFPH